MWLRAFHCIDGNNAFLWCLREEPEACCELQMQAEHSSSALGCAYTESLGHEIGSKVHFQHHEGNCDRHLHKVSLQSRSRMKFNQTLTFLIIKTKWSFFTPSLLALDKATNWWNLSCLHAESFLSKSSRFCYWADDKKKTNHQTKTTNHNNYNISLSEHFLTI